MNKKINQFTINPRLIKHSQNQIQRTIHSLLTLLIIVIIVQFDKFTNLSNQLSDTGNRFEKIKGHQKKINMVADFMIGLSSDLRKLPDAGKPKLRQYEPLTQNFVFESKPFEQELGKQLNKYQTNMLRRGIPLTPIYNQIINYQQELASLLGKYQSEKCGIHGMKFNNNDHKNNNLILTLRAVSMSPGEMDKVRKRSLEKNIEILIRCLKIAAKNKEQINSRKASSIINFLSRKEVAEKYGIYLAIFIFAITMLIPEITPKHYVQTINARILNRTCDYKKEKIDNAYRIISQISIAILFLYNAILVSHILDKKNTNKFYQLILNTTLFCTLPSTAKTLYENFSKNFHDTKKTSEEQIKQNIPTETPKGRQHIPRADHCRQPQGYQNNNQALKPSKRRIKKGEEKEHHNPDGNNHRPLIPNHRPSSLFETTTFIVDEAIISALEQPHIKQVIDILERRKHAKAKGDNGIKILKSPPGKPKTAEIKVCGASGQLRLYGLLNKNEKGKYTCCFNAIIKK